MASSTTEPSAVVGEEQACGFSQRVFSMESEAMEATLHFQILDLGRQYYIWISASGPKMANLYLAIQTPADPKPSVASLIPGPAGGAGESLAQRLALKAKKPVLVSCNLPSNTPMLQAIAERRLLQELAEMAGGGGQAAASAAVVAGTPAL
ncbi:hypothetical protein FOA52_005386 [Chlamydomonas sp. UWO 241]|nr:hypothetical protein FOA52_005386 [Chlamydomonas sp. UWO 241]